MVRLPHLGTNQNRKVLMSKRNQNDTTPAERRRAVADDVAAFLKAGNRIQQIPDGVSAQDPQGRGKPLRLGPPKDQPPADKPAGNKPAENKS